MNIRGQLEKILPKGFFTKEKSDAKRHRRRQLQWAIVVLLMILGVFSYLTNPFVRFSVVVDPYNEVSYQGGQFQIQGNDAVFVQDDAFFRRLAWLKSGWHIFSSKFSGGKKAERTTVDEIIREIHADRFDPEEPYLISGDHFSMLYPRSLGIFYHSMLDPRTALDEEDWQNRQHIYLKTLAYSLQTYEGADRLSTTILPVGPRSVTLLNWYATPSDTMYSLLFALDALQSDEGLRQTYPFERIEPADLSTGERPEAYVPELATQQAAGKLLEQHKQSLQRHLDKYYNLIYDEQTGLVRKDIHLSSTKDIVKRQSAFYDNVIFWRTMQLAEELELVELDPIFLPELKQRILATFWQEKEGIFLDDLSPESVEGKYYSSDWLIVLMTGFLDPADPEERQYYLRVTDYIQRNALDQPFALQYHADPRREQLYLAAKLFAPSYASTAIWSNWGMEYIKLLLWFAQTEGKELYLQQAADQLSAYAYNIKRYRGYPEVYDANGDFFRQTFYKSIRQTGWIVSYEQAREMYEWTDSVISN
jgi:hypothetical protein